MDYLTALSLLNHCSLHLPELEKWKINYIVDKWELKAKFSFKYHSCARKMAQNGLDYLNLKDDKISLEEMKNAFMLYFNLLNLLFLYYIV